LRRAVFAALFLVSGAAGLIYEVVWMRRVSQLLGSGVYSSRIPIGAFMAGLSLGGYA
jgi:spermidine synthase